jgi:membrane protein implicated in regulation of membrane protease activity
MNLSEATLWWVVAGVLVAVELATGTFYLLMLALGAAAGALAAHAGLGFNGQIVIGALVGGGATALWHWKRRQTHSDPAPPETNRDVQLDIGQRVHVADWAEDGTARVDYRGASWQVRYAGAGQPVPGLFVIVAVDGNVLRLAPVAA